MVIKEISLLNKTEFECNKHLIPTINQSWRLKTPAIYDNYTYCVTSNNELSEYDVAGALGIRPVLTVEFDVKPTAGNQITLFGLTWTSLEVWPNKTLLLCNENIDNRRYDLTNSHFDKSEIKEFLEKWLKEKETKND